MHFDELFARVEISAAINSFAEPFARLILVSVRVVILGMLALLCNIPLYLFNGVTKGVTKIFSRC